MSEGPRFVEGRAYKRKADIHRRFGGQHQGGIITPKNVPAIFLVTGASGKQHGYDDGLQSDGSFLYYGEGQSGDMKFIRGNRALRDHALDGKSLHLFENQGGGALVYLGQYVCDGYEIVRDSERKRDAIAFRLVRDDPDPQEQARAEKKMARKSLEELRKIAKSDGARSSKKRGGSVPTIYERSEAVKRYVRARANGTCEGCGSPAPFLDKKGEPYLEPHHTKRLSDEGPDDPSNVIAICPTCHRRAHSGKDGSKFNASLKRTLAKIEPS